MLKGKEKPGNIFQSVADFNRVLKLFGLGFFIDAETGEMRDNLANRIGFLLNLSWSVLWIIIALSEPGFDGPDEATRGDVYVHRGWTYQYQLQVILVLPLMIFNYIKRQNAERFFAKVHEFDEAMAAMNWTLHKPFYSRARRYLTMGLIEASILLLSLFRCTIFFNVLLKLENIVLEFMQSLVFLYFGEFFLLISFRFIFGTLCIYRRCSSLNANVR